MHKEIKIECGCGFKIVLTQIQYEDFDCGMMGPFNCPLCKTILMPSERRENSVKETVTEVDNEDCGWIY